MTLATVLVGGGRPPSIDASALAGLLAEGTSVRKLVYTFGPGSVALEGEDDGQPNRTGALIVSFADRTLQLRERSVVVTLAFFFEHGKTNAAQASAAFCRPRSKCATVKPNDILQSFGNPRQKLYERMVDGPDGEVNTVRLKNPPKDGLRSNEIWLYPALGMEVVIESYGDEPFAGVARFKATPANAGP